jgi:hypothetical protein
LIEYKVNYNHSDDFITNDEDDDVTFIMIISSMSKEAIDGKYIGMYDLKRVSLNCFKYLSSLWGNQQIPYKLQNIILAL